MSKIGKLAKPTIPALEERERIAREERLKETRQVCAQPHRRGDTGDMTDALGSFIKATFDYKYEQELGRKCFEACGKYISLVAMLRRITGVPQYYVIEDETNSKGGEISDDAVKDLQIKRREAEEAMKCSGLPGFRAATDLILDGAFPLPVLHGPVKRAIIQLSTCLGFCTR